MARIRFAAVCLVAALAAPPSVSAQPGKPATKSNSQHQQQAQQPQQPAPSGPAIPDAYKLNLLIRSSIIALNQANQTGNYTVLQDLGAPAFRAANDSARLAQIFASLRQRKLDLTPILFFTPKLVAQPQINPNGILRLTGYFPTTPERVNFDIYFQMIGHDWRLFGIGVAMSPADVTAAVQPSGPSPAEAKAPADAKNIAAGGAGPSAAKTADETKAAPTPSRRPAHLARKETKTEAEPTSGGTTSSAVQNGTTTNATRIDLSAQHPEAASSEAQGAGAESSATKADDKSSFWDSLFSNR